MHVSPDINKIRNIITFKDDNVDYLGFHYNEILKDLIESNDISELEASNLVIKGISNDTGLLFSQVASFIDYHF